MTGNEELRLRHVQDAMTAAGELIGRLDWPAARLAAHRGAGLRRLVQTAQTASPWHRKRLEHVDLDSLDEASLAALPTMTKDDLMANFDEIVTDDRLRLDVVEDHLERLTGDAYLFGRYHAGASSGSTGRRCVVVYDWDGWTTVYLGVVRQLLRELAAWPKAAHPPLVATVASGTATHIFYSATQTFSTPRLATRPFAVTQPLPEIVAGLGDCQPDLLFGYTSALHALSREARAGRLRIAPRLVIATSEPLLPEIRAELEQAWAVPVLNYYACSEAGAVAISCHRGGDGLHLADDLLIVEPVSSRGQRVPPGGRADKIYLTNLFNHTLPLIRYEITDEVTLLDGPCRCGSGHRLIADPQGRLDDTFTYGQVAVHPHVFRSPLSRHRSIIEYQVRQTARGATITVVCDGPAQLPALEAELITQLTELGVPSPMVSVTPAASIERHATGKLRRFVPLPAATTTRCPSGQTWSKTTTAASFTSPTAKTPQDRGSL
jgi:phenylacetate-coenzyme A ligase PaaK-like adenylate-forming protein